MDEPPSAADEEAAVMRRAIMAIERDTSLSAEQKALRRQQLMNPHAQAQAAAAGGASAEAPKVPAGHEDTLAVIDEALKCAICFNLCDRPVTVPCQHNFCLTCFTKWVQQSKTSCPKCRAIIPGAMRANPRINSALVSAIRMAKRGERPAAAAAAAKLVNSERPDEAFVTDRAVRGGKANASSGRIFVTVAPDHFGPIPASADPERNLGVRVGEAWPDRLACRQWGAHFPHVAGIAGQSCQGAQSVALSGGYEDDLDNGEWFLYTGSGGRDLSGNKRTNKEQSFDQTFDKSNLALKVSCMRGLPVRVVRSHKEKRSSYAPAETVVRYDGIYRIEKCWRSKGKQEQLMCRYLFVRCDNDPAPWTADEHGDLPRPLPKVDEITKASEVFEFVGDGPRWWDYDVATKRWGWTRPPPESQKSGEEPKKRKLVTEQQRLLKEFGCKLCAKVLSSPLSTPCGHTFCKGCLESKFTGVADTRERAAPSGRAMREAKIQKPCPTCKTDLAEFLRTATVNTDMMSIIASLQRAAKHADEKHGDVEEEEEEAEVAPSPAPLPSARPAGASERAQAEALAAFYVEFAQFDRGLLDGMLEDQGGDVRETAALCRKMKRQEQAATGTAKKAAAKASAGAGAAGSD